MRSVDEKIPVIAVVGPTASGKTAMAAALAEIFSAEVVSADSMQIYKGMDIASAKPEPAEMRGIPHHLIGFLDTEEKYSVARYVQDASAVIRDIRERGKNVVLCGGTGLYIDSLLDNIIFEAQADNTEIREVLRQRREKEGIAVLYEELKRIDSETAGQLHINNEGRIIRALEMYKLSGEKPSELKRRSRLSDSPYSPVFIEICYSDRKVLYKRIEDRVDAMLQKGLVDEAREYISLSPSATAACAIGHKEIAPFLRGEISLDEAVCNLKKATRHYAKRQITWFGRNSRINKIYADSYSDFSQAVDAAAAVIRSSGLF